MLHFDFVEKSCFDISGTKKISCSFEKDFSNWNSLFYIKNLKVKKVKIGKQSYGFIKREPFAQTRSNSALVLSFVSW